MCLTLLALAMTSIIEPLGARLTAFALTSTSTLMRQCTVFVLSEKPTIPALTPVLDVTTESGAVKTVPFAFVFPTDSQFYARRENHLGTTIIDANLVRATLPCPED